METKMILLNETHGELPMEETLCVFKTSNLFILGSLFFDEKTGKFMIKRFGQDEYFMASTFNEFHYISNEKGGFYFVNKKTNLITL